MLPPGLALPPQGSTASMSQSFQPHTMISQSPRQGLIQSAVLPPTQSVIQLQQLPHLQIVVPSGQPTATHILNAGPPPMMQRQTADPNDPLVKTFTSSCLEAYGPPPVMTSSTVQTYYSQYVPSTAAAVSPAPAITSASATVVQHAPYLRESSSHHHKRRFKEERDGDHVPDNLLGYQVGINSIFLINSISVVNSAFLSGRVHLET